MYNYKTDQEWLDYEAAGIARSTAQAVRNFKVAWTDFVLAYAKSLKLDRFVNWLEKQLTRLV